MNGRRSPDAADQLATAGDVKIDTPSLLNGHRSPTQTDEDAPGSPVQSIEAKNDPSRSDAAAATKDAADEEDAASEAETLLTSPVKRREAEKRAAAAAAPKTLRPQRSRIGGLPVPGDDDEDVSSAASPMQSTEISKANSSVPETKIEDVAMSESDDLSSLAHSAASSRASSESRTHSELPDESLRGGTNSPNPRKRKHRASSASLPSSKRQSMDPPKRKLRGVHSEDRSEGAERSTSPKLRSHRRALSTQSAVEGNTDGAGKKRGSISHFPVKEPRSATRAQWEESDASSETTSRGHDDNKRPQRGMGRSTSTPGRPGGRELKRHVNKYGFTRLAEACEDGNLDAVKEWREKDADQLELAEFAGNKPLQIAALNGNAAVVSYLIEQGCQIDCANVDKDTPLIDASENGHLEVVKLLLSAGVDPLRQNLKGQQALDVVTDDAEDGPPIRAELHKAIENWNSGEARQRREDEEEQRHRAGPSKELHFMARTYENLLKLVQINDRNGVREFLDARVPVDNAIIAAAAKTGDSYLLNMLLAEMTEKKGHQKPEKPMLSVLGSSHFDMVKLLTSLDYFPPLWRNRSGKSWPEIAVERQGPMWKQEKELLERLYDLATSSGMKERRSSSPVTKRDSGKARRLLSRHAAAAEDDDDDDDDDESDGGDMSMAKRKNGRRLMSRKDMRAHSGGKLDESSDEDAEGEDEEDEDEDEDMEEPVMKPPETPNTRRAAGRLRNKSISSQPANEAASPPSHKRTRSSSVREPAKKVLPTLEEKESDEKVVRNGESAAVSQKKQQQEEEKVKFALAQAKRLQAEREMKEEAEAEAKRKEEEAQKAEEVKRAEEARRKEEEHRRAEEARKAEEERLRRERELEEARQRYRDETLASLPAVVADMLAPDSDFVFETPDEARYLWQHFTPLRVLRTTPSLKSAEPVDWVLNLQAASLLGKRGLELFYQPSAPGHDGAHSTLADTLIFESLEIADWQWVDHVLNEFPTFARTNPRSRSNDSDTDDFSLELQRADEQREAIASARRNIRENCSVRLVKLDDVVAHLCPLLSAISIDVEFSSSANSALELVRSQLEKEEVTDLVARFERFWGAHRKPFAISRHLPRLVNSRIKTGVAFHSPVTVVHEK